MRFRPAGDDYESAIAALWEAGTEGVIETDGELCAFFDADADLGPLLAELSRYQPVVSPAERKEWAPHGEFLPLEVGERFYLVPEWRDDPPPPGRLRLTTYPGMVCGTGLHPATQLCLAALERDVRPDSVVLDVGTGSGILAAGALLLGARTVIACDIDMGAAHVARQNLGGAAGVFAGSLRSVRASRIGVLTANLNAATLIQLGDEFSRVLRRGGRLILSGFRTDEAAGLISSLGLRVIELTENAGSGCAVCALPELL